MSASEKSFLLSSAPDRHTWASSMKMAPYCLPDGGLTTEEFLESMHIAFSIGEEEQPQNPPSLLELFDDQVFEEAVDTFFPTLASETSSSSSEEAVGPSPVDLLCLETVPSTPESTQESASVAAEEPSVKDAATNTEVPENTDTNYVLDYPEVPGVDCRSCEFHKSKVREGDVKCSLCYMRLTSFMVYSKCLFYLFIVKGKFQSSCALCFVLAFHRVNVPCLFFRRCER